MSREKVLEELINGVDAQLKAGKSKAEVVAMLLQSGMSQENADRFVDTVIASQTSNAKRIGRFFALAILPVVAFIVLSNISFGASELVLWIKPAMFVAVISIGVFAVLAYVKQSALLMARCVAGWFMFASVSVLAGIMFVHPGWNTEGAFLEGQGQLFPALLRVFHHLGPQSIAWALTVLAIMLLFNFWGACHKWRTGEE